MTRGKTVYKMRPKCSLNGLCVAILILLLLLSINTSTSSNTNALEDNISVSSRSSNVFKERPAYIVYRANVVLNGIVPTSGIGEFELRYCDIVRYKDRVMQYIADDVPRKHLWDGNHAASLTRSVRQALEARAVNMDLIDRIYYPSGNSRFASGNPIEIDSFSSDEHLAYECSESVDAKDVNTMTVDQAAMTLFMNAVGSVSYSQGKALSKIDAKTDKDIEIVENMIDNDVYYALSSDISHSNNPFMDISFLSEVYTNFKLNDNDALNRTLLHENYYKYESFSSLLWNILHSSSASNFNSYNSNNNNDSNKNSNNSNNNDDNNNHILEGNAPLFIIYQSLNSDSGGSLAMRQLYMDIQSLILPFVDSDNNNGLQRKIAFYCNDDNLHHPLCTTPPDSSLVLTGEWCSGVLHEHQVRDFKGLGVQWFLGFHHRNDVCRGRVKVGHTRYIQNNIADTVMGGYFLGCAMNNKMKHYILDFVHKSQYNSANEARNDGIVPPIAKENIVIIDGDINSDYALDRGLIDFSQIFAIINKSRNTSSAIKFVIAKDLPYGDLLNLLMRSKVVVDLAFPGAERLTSEAILLGSLVVGSDRWNSGGLYDHPGILKVDLTKPAQLLEVIPRLIDNYEAELRHSVGPSQFYAHVLSEWRRSYHTTDALVSSAMLHLIIICTDSARSEYENMLTLLAYLYIFPLITVDIYVHDINWFVREHYMLFGILQESGYIKLDPMDPLEHNSWNAEMSAVNARINSDGFKSEDKQVPSKATSSGISFINIIPIRSLKSAILKKVEAGKFDLSFLFPPSSNGKLGIVAHNNLVLPSMKALKSAAKRLSSNNKQQLNSKDPSSSVLNLFSKRLSTDRSDTGNDNLNKNESLADLAATIYYNNEFNGGTNAFNRYIFNLLIGKLELSPDELISVDVDYWRDLKNSDGRYILNASVQSISICSLYEHDNYPYSHPQASSLPSTQDATSELPFVYGVARSVNWMRFVMNIRDSEISKTLCR